MTDQELINTLQAALDFVRSKAVRMETRPSAPAPQGDGLPWHEGKVCFAEVKEVSTQKGTVKKATIGVRFPGEEKGLFMSCLDNVLAARVEQLQRGDRVSVQMKPARDPKYTDLVGLRT